MLPLAVSLGEPAGVGAEILLAAYAARVALGLPAFFAVGSVALLRARSQRLGLSLTIDACAPERAEAHFPTALPVLDTGHSVSDAPGRLDPANAPAVIAWIEAAVRAVAEGRAGGIVTLPIHKANLYAAGFPHPGHTEFLGALAERLHPGEPARPVMMLAAPHLRTVPVTVHIPLGKVAEALTAEAIVETATIVDRDLRRRFGIARPRIAVAGLNPHAGESCTMGREDEDIVRPAVERLMAAGIDAVGPLPADTMFHAAARHRYDVAIAMYHDQALIPVKTLAFDEAVNVTLGLPFVRTSPDHGTALDIAGRGVARADSFVAALRLAADLAGR